MGYKEGGKGDGAIDAVKSMGRFDMVFESSVESFNELFEGSVGCRLVVEILESDDFPVGKVFFSLGIQEVYPCRVGGVAIGHEDEGLVWVGGANGFFHGDDGGERFSVIGHVVGGDFEALGREEEEDIVAFAHDLDVGLIACADFVDGSLILEVEAVAVEGSGRGIVQDCLIGDGDTEYGAEDEGRFSGAQGKGDIEGEDEAEDMGSFVDSGEIDSGLFGAGRGEFVRLVMILPILIPEFKLGASFGPQRFFSLIELFDLACPVKALIVTALIEGNLFLLFPLE